MLQIEETPEKVSGTLKKAEYLYKMRPFREQWLALAATAVVRPVLAVFALHSLMISLRILFLQQGGHIFEPPSTVEVLRARCVAYLSIH